MSSEEALSQCVWVTECVSGCPVSDLALCPLSITHVSSDTSPPPLFLLLLLRESKPIEAGGLPRSESLQRGTSCTACKSPSLIHTHTHIQGDPVSACLALPRVVISHQADQRTTAGSERTPDKEESIWLAGHRSSSADREAHSPPGCRFRSGPPPEMRLVSTRQFVFD